MKKKHTRLSLYVSDPYTTGLHDRYQRLKDYLEELEYAKRQSDESVVEYAVIALESIIDEIIGHRPTGLNS